MTSTPDAGAHDSESGKTLNFHSASLHPGEQVGTSKRNTGGNLATDEHPIQAGGVEIFLDASCFGNRYKLWPDGSLGWYADLLARL